MCEVLLVVTKEVEEQGSGLQTDPKRRGPRLPVWSGSHDHISLPEQAGTSWTQRRPLPPAPCARPLPGLLPLLPQ